MSRSAKLKAYWADHELSGAHRDKLNSGWTDERRRHASETARTDGSDAAVIAKRQAGFAALPMQTCECGLVARQHAMTRHKRRCGQQCAVECCNEVQSMNGWCRYHFKLSQLARSHSITPQQLFDIARRANDRCEICKTMLRRHGDTVKNEATKACLDHCHDTGVVRGILCFNCNSGIGHLKDDVQRLQAAIDYLIAASNN